MRFGFWEFIDQGAPIPIEKDKLYRATFSITSSGERLPVFRQRMIVRNLYIGSESIITPTVPNGAVFQYAAPDGLPSQESSNEIVCYLPIEDYYLPGDDLLFSMDVYGPVIDTDPYCGIYYVNGITVEELDVP